MVQENEMNINSEEQVRWHCRRGMLELDKILLAFFDANYKTMSDEGKELFVKFLGNSDQDIYNWIFKSDIPKDSRLYDLVLLLKYSYASECTQTTE